jgi:hypothetical protein
MKSFKFACFCAALTFLAGGCARNHRAVYDTQTPAPVVTSTATTTTVPPTSDRPAARVYQAPPTVTPPSEPPPGVSASDVNIATSVSQLLKADSSLADASRNIEATVDNGVVTLRGSVPTDHDRDEIVGRISRLPGVARVHDHLGVALR